MFFTLSKIFWALVAPLNLVFILLVAGGVLIVAGIKQAGRSVMILGLVLFIVFGVFPTGHNMLVLLERQYERPQLQDMPAWVHNILVLGGGIDTEITQARRVPAITSAGGRLIDTMGLARRYPNAIIIHSGGNGLLRQHMQERPEGKALYTESEAVAAFFAQAGFSDQNVLYEDESRNSYENIRFTRDLFIPLAGENWVVVTSAYHMPRVIGIMKTLRWPGEIIPYPADYRTDGEMYWLPRRLDIFGNFYHSHTAVREYIGLLAYQLSGKISYPFSE